ncbi:MAG TPA: lysylphosphatidylglycerol synthase domain-containing protein, partial [Candidatus Polarisedimenticolia bacterium]|nr:lysylphosphatidylglycerol synthase domain-containing protein [Candidatus Polarisedimenticolia bacterium]
FAGVAGVQMIAFAAIGARVGAAEAAFAVAGAGFIQVMAAAPGGSGVTEASLIYAFIALGVDEESAAAGVLLARLAHYAVLFPWGGASFYALQRRHGMPRAASAEAPA